MNPFVTWTAIAVPFDQANLDTNQICPTRFNKVEKGPRYAKVLFHDLRFDAAGEEKRDFILNTEPYRRAGIIVADRNFGCGSSRESAVFALATFGMRRTRARFRRPSAATKVAAARTRRHFLDRTIFAGDCRF
jgi:3-isopropylmalate/(R)-2-methylmalate dehydratase small subunit